MTWIAPKTAILFNLIDILRLMDEDVDAILDECVKVEGISEENITLERLQICHPVGHGVLLELKERIEAHFDIRFEESDLPGFFESTEVTLGEIASVIKRKIDESSAKTAT